MLRSGQLDAKRKDSPDSTVRFTSLANLLENIRRSARMTYSAATIIRRRAPHKRTRRSPMSRTSSSTLTDKPIVNSHMHPDHVFGNAVLKEDNPQFVDQHKL